MKFNSSNEKTAIAGMMHSSTKQPMSTMDAVTHTIDEQQEKINHQKKIYTGGL